MATHTLDPNLLSQWLFGSGVVYFYARDRFDNPGQMRCTTTFTRYWIARTGYMLSVFMLYLLMGGAVTDINTKPLWEFINIAPGTGDAQLNVKNPPELPAPLFAALLLTSFLPRLPYLSKIDEAVKQWFQRIGNIPFEVRELSGQIEASRFSIQPEMQNKLLPHLGLLGVDKSWLSAPEHSFKYRWARVAALFALIENWEKTPGYSRYIHEHKVRFDDIVSRVETMGGLNESTLDHLDQDAAAPSAAWRKKLPREIVELHRSLCDFIAGGLLQSEWRPNQRQALMAQLGFDPIQKPMRTLTAHQVLLVGGVIFLVMMFMAIVWRSFFNPAQPGLNLRVIFMVPVIYSVAIVLAIYPKSVWPIADIRLVGDRPIAGYVLSGLCAAGAAFIISLLFRFLQGKKGATSNLLEVLSSPGSFTEALLTSLHRWPWLFMTFFATIAIAWAADDHVVFPDMTSKSLRKAETLILGIVFGCLQWMTVHLLVSFSGWHGSMPRMVLTAALLGACIGFFVPHFYRARSIVSLPPPAVARASAAS